MSNNNFDLFSMKVEEVDTPYDSSQEKSNKNIDLLDLEYKELEEYLNKMCNVQTYIDAEINKNSIKINEQITKKEAEEKSIKEIEKNNKIKFIKTSIDEISKGFDRLEETLKKFKPYK
jgi:hypothetical protein